MKKNLFDPMTKENAIAELKAAGLHAELCKISPGNIMGGKTWNPEDIGNGFTLIPSSDNIFHIIFEDRYVVVSIPHHGQFAPDYRFPLDRLDCAVIFIINDYKK